VTKLELSDMEKELRIYLRDNGEIAKRFWTIKEHMGLKNDTEVLRSLINYYWKEHEEVLKPRLEHFNFNEQGMLVLDRDLNSIVQIRFNPKVYCEHCKSTGCQHVKFARSLPELQEKLRLG